MLFEQRWEGSLTLKGRAQSLLRRSGRHPSRDDDPRRPHAVRRGRLLLVSGLAAALFAPHAAADPTATTPAPDPNPPPGAAPDPYSPPAKSAPAPVIHHVYSAPVTPVHSAPRAYTPRLTVTHTPTRVAHPKRKRRAVHHHRRVVHHQAKPVVGRFTPQLDSYIASVVKTMGAAVVTSDDGTPAHRRREAGLALFALAALSFSLLLRLNRLRL